MEQQPRKGLSKGCLIALIVAGALLVLFIALSAYVCSNQDSLVRWLTKSGFAQVKVKISKNPPQGVDTTRFYALCDTFVARIYRDSISAARQQEFLPVLQKVAADDKFEASEIGAMTDAIVKYYPDLEPMSRGIWSATPASPDSLTPVDSTKVTK
jgi:hypothetical protein